MADEYINKTELLFEMATSLIPQSMDITRGYAIAKDLIRNAPVADVAPVKHGRWLDMDVLDTHYQPVYKCSECGKEVADYYIDNHKYCLHCGTLMDGNSKREVGFYIDPKNYNISQRLSDGGSSNGIV